MCDNEIDRPAVMKRRQGQRSKAKWATPQHQFGITIWSHHMNINVEKKIPKVTATPMSTLPSRATVVGHAAVGLEQQCGLKQRGLSNSMRLPQ
jgi:hypothetical protein